MLRRQQGFSLLEVILAMALSSIMMVSVTSLFPGFIRQYLNSYRLYRVEQAMSVALLNIEKDLRRAGFIKEGRVGNAVSFSQSSGNIGSCLIIRYDLNGNGKIEEQESYTSEVFGYRLHQGALEQHRGALHCSGNGWEKITDLSEVEITNLDVEKVNADKEITYFIIRLNGHWRGNLSLSKRLFSIVKAENL